MKDLLNKEISDKEAKQIIKSIFGKVKDMIKLLKQKDINTVKS